MFDNFQAIYIKYTIVDSNRDNRSMLNIREVKPLLLLFN